jgi:glycosyltransferase involved in cell wall biosynthesis
MLKEERLVVAIFAQYYPPDLGGSATRAYNVAKGLALNGCDVTVVAAFPHYPNGDVPEKYRWKPVVVENDDGVRVIRTFILPLKSEGFLKRLLLMGSFGVSALLASVFVRNVKVVWASSWAPAAVFGKASGKPVVLNVDDITLTDITDLNLIDENSIILQIAKIVYGFFYKLGDAITPISPGYIDVISSRYGVSRDRFHVVLAGVDLSTFNVKPRKNNGSGKFIVLYSGALSVAYDFDQVISAAKVLSTEAPDAEFVIQGDGEYAESIERAIKEAGLRNILLINRIVSRAEVAELLSGADALILPLRDFGRPYLGLSTKLYEYQAVGKPIICCSKGVPGHYVSETKSGIVVEPGDYKGLAETVLYLKKNPLVATKLGDSGRQYVESNLSIDKIGYKMMTILKKLRARTLDFF